MPDATIEFSLDADYFREFHAEWVAAAGRGWRVDRVMIRVFALVGIGLIGVGLAVSMAALVGGGALLCFFGLLEFVKGRLKTARWMARALSMPRRSVDVRLEIEHGALRQVPWPGSEDTSVGVAELLDTPNGYLLRAERAQMADLGVEVSPAQASVYVPHRAIRPAMSRDAFRALLSSPGAELARRLAAGGDAVDAGDLALHVVRGRDERARAVDDVTVRAVVAGG